MSLQDIITNTLPPEEEPLSPSEIIQSSKKRLPSSLEMADMAHEIAGGDFEKVPLFAAWMCSGAYTSSWPRTTSGVLLVLFRAEEALRGDRAAQAWIQEHFLEYEEGIRQAAKMRRRGQAVGNIQGALDYLQVVLEEETVSSLATLCSVREATSSSWLRGRMPRSGSVWRICAFAREAWRMCEEEGVQASDFRSWLRTPLPSGQQPLDVWYPARMPDELLEAMRELQASSESTSRTSQTA